MEWGGRTKYRERVESMTRERERRERERGERELSQNRKGYMRNKT